MIRLNLGCGRRHKKGFLNVDKEASVKPDLVLDLNSPPFPFKDNSVEYVYSFHCLEHLNEYKFMDVLAELWRVSAPGCIWEFHVPYYNCTTLGNLDHHINFGFDSFNFLRPTHDRHYYSGAKCEILSVRGVPSVVGRFVPTNWLRRRLSYFIGQVLKGLEFKLRVVKP